MFSKHGRYNIFWQMINWQVWASCQCVPERNVGNAYLEVALQEATTFKAQEIWYDASLKTNMKRKKREDENIHISPFYLGGN